MDTNNKTDEIVRLKKIAHNIRLATFNEIANSGYGHYGGSLSISEILAVLYFKFLKVFPEKPLDENRDRFILSKGHAGPALYAAMALRGYYPLEELKNLDKPLSRFPKHIDRLKLEGIEASTGPLGQGLSLAAGMGISFKQQHRKNKIFIIMGDGECDSGQVWEAAMTAAKYKLDNLISIIDRNNLQIDGTCDEVMPTGSLEKKFSAFGWKTFRAEGHDISSLIGSIEKAEKVKDKPSVIVAKTVKGYGVSFMENRPEWHSGGLTEEQYKIAISELGGEV